MDWCSITSDSSFEIGDGIGMSLEVCYVRPMARPRKSTWTWVGESDGSVGPQEAEQEGGRSLEKRRMQYF